MIDTPLLTTKLYVPPLLIALINEIAAALTDPSKDSGHDLALVLDDYHVISDLPIHDALNFLIKHLPPQMHQVIASRIVPPLPLSRLRARNQLTDLRSADLRFTLDKATAFLNQVMCLNLPADDLAVLEG